MRQDGLYARVYVGSYGPTYVWWTDTTSGGKIANVRDLGKDVGDRFWNTVGNSQNVVVYADRDGVYAAHPDLPSQVINLGDRVAFP